MAVANVADPVWVLSEETGRLRYERLRYVVSRPKQRLIVEHISDNVAPEWKERYQRIAMDRMRRGLDNG